MAVIFPGRNCSQLLPSKWRETIFDDAIVKYVRKKYGLMIGEQTAEEIKITIGTAFEKPEPKVMDVKGRDLVTGLPKTIRVTSEDTRDALKEVTSQIVDAVHSVLERTPRNWRQTW